VQGLSLLFDPFVPLAGAGQPLPLESFLPAPRVFITHGHFDHIAAVSELVQRGAQVVYVTATPRASLAKQGVSDEALCLIEPGSTLRFALPAGSSTSKATHVLPTNNNDSAEVIVEVKQGRHISFDAALVLSTLLNPRMLRYGNNTRTILRANRIYKEKGETVVYEVSQGNKRITVLGSLALSSTEHYTQGVDLLILPLQGNTKLVPIALSIVDRIQPRTVLLSHFDDSFPPVSRSIDPAPFIAAMAKYHPSTQVIVPKSREVHRSID